MGGQSDETGCDGAEMRPVVYCLLPSDLAPTLHDSLRRHFRNDAGIEVVVDRRRTERRAADDRRQVEAGDRRAAERRQIRAEAGRRVGERRATLVAVDAPPLPRKARPHAERIAFVERFEPTAQTLEDRDTARLIASFQAGERESTFTALYERYFDRVYAYLRATLRDTHEAEDVTQQVFTEIFAKLGDYERRRQPFRAWLFIVVRNQAVSRLRKSGRAEVTDPAKIDRHLDRPEADQAQILDWISDRDLLLFVERLPLPQRQVLLLRYVLGLSNIEIAEVLGQTAMNVGRLHYRAVTYLRERLAAVRHPAAGHARRAESRRPLTHVHVLRARRFALTRHA